MKIEKLRKRIQKLKSLNELTEKRLQRQFQKIKKSIVFNVNNNINKKNFIRNCRIVNFVDYYVKVFFFYISRFYTHINIFNQIFIIYEQLFYAQFLFIFAQITLSKIIDKINQSELNEIK